MSACRARRRIRRCAARRSPAGSSADRRRARRRWRRWKMRSPECRAGAPPAPTARTDCANSGPRMISAPSLIACLRAGLRALRRAAVVFHQQLDVRILEFGERHFGRVLHRLRRDAGIALRRQRQDQADTDLPRCRSRRRAAAQSAPRCCRRSCRICRGRHCRRRRPPARAPRRRKVSRSGCACASVLCFAAAASPTWPPQATDYGPSPNGKHGFCRAKVKAMKRKGNSSPNDGHVAAV